MDHSSGGGNNSAAETQVSSDANSSFDPYVTSADGNQYRVPYHMIKKAIFTDVSKREMVDIPHAARLQYRLMLKDPIIKATVDFTKSKITVIYNPDTADNLKEKISLDKLIEFLAGEGININRGNVEIQDYDYVKNLYDYAYMPPKIRERIPYGYTKEQWEKLKPEWEQKMKDSEAFKKEKLRKFRENYLESNPEMAAKIDPNFKPAQVRPVGFFGKLMGKDKKKDKKDGEKGFWFHGI